LRFYRTKSGSRRNTGDFDTSKLKTGFHVVPAMDSSAHAVVQYERRFGGGTNVEFRPLQ
jgi:hypothetical protein